MDIFPTEPFLFLVFPQIYEYGSYSTYAIDSPERFALTDPVWEIVDLNDYRRRYAQYHRDEGLQNLRARAPQLSVRLLSGLPVSRQPTLDSFLLTYSY